MNLAYEADIAGLQGTAVDLSVRGDYALAENLFRAATDLLAAPRNNTCELERFTMGAHLGRIARDRALNLMRQSATEWQMVEKRNDALAEANEYLAASMDQLQNAVESKLGKDSYLGHLFAELGATFTASGRHAGLRLLEAQQFEDRDASTYWQDAMLDEFRDARTNLQQGNNYFYTANGYMVEALYKKALLGISPFATVRSALLSLASRRPGVDRQKGLGSFVKRLPEVYRVTSTRVLAHI